MYKKFFEKSGSDVEIIFEESGCDVEIFFMKGRSVM